MWDEARAIAAAQNADGANGAVLGGAGAGSGIAGGSGRSGGSGAELATVRPVWLALAGGKLFLREKVGLIFVEGVFFRSTYLRSDC